MDFFEAIYGRRSIRKYTDADVPDDLIEIILAAAMAAPSAGNQQPWHFVVMRDRDTLNQITEFHEYSAMLKEAPVAIAVCADLSIERHKGYWVQDCSAATQNLLLAAHAKGLGAVWLGVHPRPPREEGLKKLLNLPESVEPFCIVSLGWPAEEKGPSNRFKDERVHRDKW